MEIAREKLEEWKRKKYSYEQMANEAGVCVSTIRKYLRKYGLIDKRTVSEEDKKLFCEMRIDGYSTEKIADLTGYSIFSVNKALKAAGLTRGKKTEADREAEQNAILTPQIVRYARRRKPRITRLTVKGRSYKDVTDIYIPW